jgi:hypothetical protein
VALREMPSASYMELHELHIGGNEIGKTGARELPRLP